MKEFDVNKLVWVPDQEVMDTVPTNDDVDCKMLYRDLYYDSVLVGRWYYNSAKLLVCHKLLSDAIDYSCIGANDIRKAEELLFNEACNSIPNILKANHDLAIFVAVSRLTRLTDRLEMCSRMIGSIEADIVAQSALITNISLKLNSERPEVKNAEKAAEKIQRLDKLRDSISISAELLLINFFNSHRVKEISIKDIKGLKDFVLTIFPYMYIDIYKDSLVQLINTCEYFNWDGDKISYTGKAFSSELLESKYNWKFITFLKMTQEEKQLVLDAIASFTPSSQS